MIIGGSISGAMFIGDKRRFRIALWRIWDKSLGALLFIGLNPSNAAQVRDDPTVRRVILFAKSWGFGGLYVGNLFGLVTPDPVDLYFDTSPELKKNGPNDRAIKRMRELSTTVMVGWGDFGKYAGTRPAEVLALVGEPVHCIKVNRSGEPSHPLYLPANSKLIRYERGRND